MPMKQIYSTIKTLAFAAIAMVATTATAQETASFTGTFAELKAQFGFPVSSSANQNAGNIAGNPINFGLLTLSATDNNKTATRMWEANSVVSLRIYKGSSVTLRANREGVKLTRIQFTASAFNPATNLTVTAGALAGDVWTGSESEITFTATSGNVQVTAISADLLVEGDVTAITSATVPAFIAGTTPVYNLQGQKVATYATFLTLPKGLYIINGQKVVR